MKFCRWSKPHHTGLKSAARTRNTDQTARQVAGIGIALTSEKGGPLMSTTSARFTSSSPAITRKPGRSANLDADVRQVGIQLDDFDMWPPVLSTAAFTFSNSSAA